MGERSRLAADTGRRSDATRTRAPRSGRQVMEDVHGLAATLSAASEEWTGMLRKGTERNPYVALGVAAGVGYVLAGGLAPSAVRLAIRTGWRFAGAALMRELVESVRSADSARHD